MKRNGKNGIEIRKRYEKFGRELRPNVNGEKKINSFELIQQALAERTKQQHLCN